MAVAGLANWILAKQLRTRLFRFRQRVRVISMAMGTRCEEIGGKRTGGRKGGQGVWLAAGLAGSPAARDVLILHELRIGCPVTVRICGA